MWQFLRRLNTIVQFILWCFRRWEALMPCARGCPTNFSRCSPLMSRPSFSASKPHNSIRHHGTHSFTVGDGTGSSRGPSRWTDCFALDRASDRFLLVHVSVDREVPIYCFLHIFNRLHK